MTGHMNPEGHIKVRTRFRCQCLEAGGTYRIFTNRRVRRNKKGKLRLRIKENDMVIRSDDDVIQQIKKGCDVRRKVRKTIRELKKGL